MVISGDVAISGRASGSSWSQRADPPWTERPDAFRFSIGLPFAQDPIRRFGQMSGHCPNGLRVALAPGDAVIETAHVAACRAAPRETDRVRRFDERPLEVAVGCPRGQNLGARTELEDC
jgi:hypothetical protein